MIEDFKERIRETFYVAAKSEQHMLEIDHDIITYLEKILNIYLDEIYTAFKNSMKTKKVKVADILEAMKGRPEFYAIKRCLIIKKFKKTIKNEDEQVTESSDILSLIKKLKRTINDNEEDIGESHTRKKLKGNIDDDDVLISDDLEIESKNIIPEHTLDSMLNDLDDKTPEYQQFEQC
ncbi:hypothetical protein BDK51DRAFT_46268 [Blyttiomyces helicus]|uniref:Uncharacterized protein n=1 Tax=Blyttiomyces helicus TaxID=388810 RepID=A0A4P9W3R0_9FUNG|nr:hypothetical protein BDK51DRAFT_43257 [Blyttiomyces helicus]RKO85935.1 hypothetical protein BDK51DRAFT_46268 [Blyttiomyces helicus]|eukprot:RKO82992.1 hypothetical protein BDK51DRAFT_43257 [Blyttiomyces helicus]